MMSLGSLKGVMDTLLMYTTFWYTRPSPGTPPFQSSGVPFQL
jgi:hypothetical protein